MSGRGRAATRFAGPGFGAARGWAGAIDTAVIASRRSTSPAAPRAGSTPRSRRSSSLSLRGGRTNSSSTTSAADARRPRRSMRWCYPTSKVRTIILRAELPLLCRSLLRGRGLRGGLLCRGLRCRHRAVRAERREHSSTCPSTFTLGKTLAIVPSGPMTKVLRIVPSTFLPYIVFSPHAPNARCAREVRIAEERDSSARACRGRSRGS